MRAAAAAVVQVTPAAIESAADLARRLGEWMAAKDAVPDLPVIDGTGKVHGPLPKREDLDLYDPEDLSDLADQLRDSIRKRIEVTERLGPDRGHTERVAAEQLLLRQIERYLNEL